MQAGSSGKFLPAAGFFSKGPQQGISDEKDPRMSIHSCLPFP